MNTTRPPPQDSYGDEEEESSGPSIDAELVRSYVNFLRRAIRKSSLACGIVFVVSVLIAFAVLSILPRNYHTESRLTAQNTGPLGGGDRPSASLEGASATILSYGNLNAIVKQVDLTGEWRKSPPPIQQLKHLLMGSRAESSDRDLTTALVQMLETHLSADVQNDVLTITADWHEPNMAARLVEAAQQNFIETRHISEISLMATNISILERNAARVQNEVSRIGDEVKAQRAEKAKKALQGFAPTSTASAKPDDGAKAAGHPAAAPKAAVVDEDLASIRTVLDAKQQALKELDSDRARRTHDLQAKLREQLLQFTESHPDVVQTKMYLAALSAESPQVIALRSEVKDLEGQVRQRASVASAASAAAGRPYVPPPSGKPGLEQPPAQLPNEILQMVHGGGAADDLDPTLAASLELAVSNHYDLQGRIYNARIELDRATLAFENRYKILTPAQVPTKPTKPKPLIIIGAGVAAGLLFALLAAVLRELRSGTIVEHWQVQHLGLPILGRIKLPPGSS